MMKTYSHIRRKALEKGRFVTRATAADGHVRVTSQSGVMSQLMSQSCVHDSLASPDVGYCPRRIADFAFARNPLSNVTGVS